MMLLQPSSDGGKAPLWLRNSSIEQREDVLSEEKLSDSMPDFCGYGMKQNRIKSI